nr:unnamed protein product [Digitaria exilis]
MGGASAGASSGKGKVKGKGKGNGKDAWEVVSIVLRIATVGMSLASAVTTIASTQCDASSQVDDPTGAAASCGTYGSFTKTIDLIDKVVLALTSTSGPLLLAADDITSCGPPRSRRRRNNNGARQQSLAEKLQGAGFLSLGPLITAATNEVVKKLKQPHEVVVVSATGRGSTGVIISTSVAISTSVTSAASAANGGDATTSTAAAAAAASGGGATTSTRCSIQ